MKVCVVGGNIVGKAYAWLALGGVKGFFLRRGERAGEVLLLLWIVGKGGEEVEWRREVTWYSYASKLGH